jgi:predicted ATP-dependent protease
MHCEQTTDMRILADARRGLNAHAEMHEQSQFTPEESARRVAFYAAQVEAEGQITRWLAAAPPKPKTRHRTRFAFGDALATHMTVCRA